MEDWFHSILQHLYYTYPLDHTWHNINSYLTGSLDIKSDKPEHMVSLGAIISILKENEYIDGNFQPLVGQERRNNIIGVFILPTI